MKISVKVLEKMKELLRKTREDVEKYGFGRSDTGEVSRHGAYVELDTMGYGVGLRRFMNIEQALVHRYKDYEEMDYYPEISSALDVYANDATVVDKYHKSSIWVVARDAGVRGVLMDLLRRRIDVEDHIWMLARTVAKYGNAFAELLVIDKGVVGLNFLPPTTVRRVEDENGNLIGFIQSPSGGFGGISWKMFKEKLDKGERYVNGMILFEPWEVIHWRLLGRNLADPYGYSVVEAARWAWRRLMLAEDAALVFKLTKGASRYAFYVDAGDLTGAEARAEADSVRRAIKRKAVADSSIGKVDFRADLTSLTEDFFIPVINGQEAIRIDVIGGAEYTMSDVIENLKNQLYASLKVPKSYLGIEGEVSSRILSQEDVNFARAVMRLQRALIVGYEQIMRTDLSLHGIDPDDVDFRVEMAAPSYIFELAQMELRNAQAENANTLSQFMPQEWILRHVFDFSEGDAAFIIEKKREEVRREQLDMAEIQQEIAERYPGATMDMEGVKEGYLYRGRKIEESTGAAGRKGNVSVSEGQEHKRFIKRLESRLKKIEQREERIERNLRRVLQQVANQRTSGGFRKEGE